MPVVIKRVRRRSRRSSLGVTMLIGVGKEAMAAFRPRSNALARPTTSQKALGGVSPRRRGISGGPDGAVNGAVRRGRRTTAFIGRVATGSVGPTTTSPFIAEGLGADGFRRRSASRAIAKAEGAALARFITRENRLRVCVAKALAGHGRQDVDDLNSDAGGSRKSNDPLCHG